VQQDVAEATALGDDVMKKIVGTSLDKPSEITALAAMEEQERQQIIERAVAGETVSAPNTAALSSARMSPFAGCGHGPARGVSIAQAVSFCLARTPNAESPLPRTMACRQDARRRCRSEANILHAMYDPNIFATHFRDGKSWQAWRAFLGVPTQPSNNATLRVAMVRVVFLSL
jgi:hypothetical protein